MQLMLCCNDRHGNCGELIGVDVGTDCETLSLEGDLMDGDKCRFVATPMGDACFAVLKGKFSVMKRRRYVGNIHWDLVEMPDAVAVRFINHLRRQPHWSCQVARSDLFRKWERGDEFTVEDFAGAISQ